MTKQIALAAALVAGLSTAAFADNPVLDSVHNYGPIAGQYQSQAIEGRNLFEGRNVFSPTAPTAEELWFQRQSKDINS